MSKLASENTQFSQLPHLQPITGPMVWNRADLINDTGWIIQLNQRQLNEIHLLVRKFGGAPLKTIEVDKTHFRACSELIRHTRVELDRGRGVVLFRGIDPEQYQLKELRIIMWILGTAVGVPMVQNARGELLGEVTDRGHDYDANNVRGYTTRRELAFHCDASEIVALLCVHPAREGGSSKIVCAAAIHNEILANRPELLAPLYRGYHFDLRGEGSKGEHNEVTQHRVPVFHYHSEQLSIRFNYKTIVDGMRKAGLPVTGIDLEALDYVRELSSREDLKVDMDFQPGDIQWLSNHDVLHARDEFLDWPEPNRKRRLLRMWLSLPHGRPLRDEFSDRFNNGPKNGPVTVSGAGYWAGA